MAWTMAAGFSGDRVAVRALKFGSVLAVAGLLLSGCAASGTDPADPYESFNREVFDLNLRLDRNFAKPLAKGYIEVVPEPARDGVHNFITNLNQPVIFINSVLQGEANEAADTFGRFLVDSTVGVGGLVDVAGMWGMPSHDNDFGITLGRYGVGQGAFLMLPFVGPSTPRDLSGKIVDIGLDPTTYVSFRSKIYFDMGLGFVSVVDTRAQTLDEVDSLQRTSVDFYATTRNLYLQYRKAQVNHGKPDIEDLPNF